MSTRENGRRTNADRLVQQGHHMGGIAVCNMRPCIEWVAFGPPRIFDLTVVYLSAHPVRLSISALAVHLWLSTLVRDSDKQQLSSSFIMEMLHTSQADFEDTNWWRLSNWISVLTVEQTPNPMFNNPYHTSTQHLWLCHLHNLVCMSLLLTMQMLCHLLLMQVRDAVMFFVVQLLVSNICVIGVCILRNYKGDWKGSLVHLIIICKSILLLWIWTIWQKILTRYYISGPYWTLHQSYKYHTQ